jgi:hypothetical protein
MGAFHRCQRIDFKLSGEGLIILFGYSRGESEN